MSSVYKSAGVTNSVTIDAVGTPVTGSGGTNLAPSVVVSSHSNRALVLMIAIGDNSQKDPVGTVVSNQGGTFVKKAEVNGTDFTRAEMWVMVAPTVATHIVTATTTGGASWDLSAAVAVSLYNVDQSVPTGTAVQVGGTGTSVTSGSVTLTTGQMLMGINSSDSEATNTITAGTILSGSFPILNMGSDLSASAGTRTTTGALTWTTADEFYALVGAPFNPI